MRIGHHLIVGGQRSGKSGQAERLALAAGLEVCVIATAQAGDQEMAERIAHHRAMRPAAFGTVESPLALAEVLRTEARPGRLLLVDCLTLWLTNWLMPLQGPSDLHAWQRERQALLDLMPDLPSPLILISNEVGWGVSPMSREARFFVDELGRLNQAVASRCRTLTLMVAGQPWSRTVIET